MTYKLYRFGSTLLPVINTAGDIGSGGSRIQVRELSGGGYFDERGSGQAPRSLTNISLKCSLLSADAEALDTYYNTYRALRGERSQLFRQRADGDLEWCWARLEGIGGVRSGRVLRRQEVDFSFVMLSPDWYGETQVDQVYPDLGADDEDLATCGAESGGSPYTIYGLENAGNQDQPDVILTITAGSSAITSLTVTNTTSGHAWTYAGTIAIGESLVVDCGLFTVLNDGVDDYANFTPPTNKEQWMVLEPGTNVITVAITGGGTGSAVEIEFYDAYA